MALLLMVEDPSSSLKISARPMNKWNYKGHETHTIPALYCVIAAATGLFTTILIMPWQEMQRFWSHRLLYILRPPDSNRMLHNLNLQPQHSLALA